MEPISDDLAAARSSKPENNYGLHPHRLLYFICQNFVYIDLLSGNQG